MEQVRWLPSIAEQARYCYLFNDRLIISLLNVLFVNTTSQSYLSDFYASLDRSYQLLKQINDKLSSNLNSLYYYRKCFGVRCSL